MDSTNSDPYTLSTPLYSGSQSPVKVPASGPVPNECVPPSSSSSQSTQTIAHKLKPTLDFTLFAGERRNCTSFFNMMENIVFILDELDRLEDDDPEAAKKRRMWQEDLVYNRNRLQVFTPIMHR